MRFSKMLLVLGASQALVVVPLGRHHHRTAPLMATYQVTLQMPDGETATIPCADDEFILDAAEEAGFELPSSCRSGSCTSCQGRVLAGSVSMDEQDTLEEDDIKAGYVCTCISYPESDVTIKTHQMDNFEAGIRVFDDLIVNGAPALAAAAAAVPEPLPVPPPPVVAEVPPPPPPPVVAEVAPVVAEVAPVVAGTTALDPLKVGLAKQTLSMFKDVVAGRPDLEAKCDELLQLLEGGPVSVAAAPASVEEEKVEAEYTPYVCEDVGYTIWMNKNDYRNSWYEYHPKKK